MGRLGCLVFLLLCAVDCTRGQRDGANTELDPRGRAMLDPLRQETLRPAELVAQLGLDPHTSVVADVGAGPGFFTHSLAVAAHRVIATDIDANYLRHLAAQAARDRLTNVETRLTSAGESGLDPASVDVVLLCQVDHYLPDRRADFSSLRRALKPGGRIAIVNAVRYQEAARLAAESAGLHLLREWKPSPPYYLALFQP